MWVLLILMLGGPEPTYFREAFETQKGCEAAAVFFNAYPKAWVARCVKDR